MLDSKILVSRNVRPLGRSQSSGYEIKLRDLNPKDLEREVGTLDFDNLHLLSDNRLEIDGVILTGDPEAIDAIVFATKITSPRLGLLLFQTVQEADFCFKVEKLNIGTDLTNLKMGLVNSAFFKVNTICADYIHLNAIESGLSLSVGMALPQGDYIKLKYVDIITNGTALDVEIFVDTLKSAGFPLSYSSRVGGFCLEQSDVETKTASILHIFHDERLRQAKASRVKSARK